MIADNGSIGKLICSTLIRPKVSNQPPLPDEVPQEFSMDYLEACLVLADSPKASAALNRRCLQNIIQNKLVVKGQNLFEEIKTVIETKHLPTEITETLEPIRHTGNFAAHPKKNINTGEIINVEPQEAEWNLEVIEMLFDHLFVQPERRKKRMEALGLKISDASKKVENEPQ
jgi:hypothetical protein